MAFASGHIITAWIFGKLIELKKGFKFGRWGWMILLFGGLFPDSDLLLDWTFGTHIHRTFTHSFFMIIAGFIAVLLITKLAKKIFKNKELNPFVFAFAFSLGIFTHLFIDMALGIRGVPLLWPLHYRFWYFGISSADYVSMHFAEMDKNILIKLFKSALVDMALGVIWLGYLLFKGKIKKL